MMLTLQLGQSSARRLRDVIAELKKKQVTGAAILPFFENRLHAIEKIIAAEGLVSLPSRPAAIPPQYRPAGPIRVALEHSIRNRRRRRETR